jgi:hypothetical protein
MAYSKKDVQRAKQAVAVGVGISTSTLDATTTVEILQFGGAMSKVTFQGSGNLVGTVEFSVNGINWFSSTAIAAANAPTTFSTHNFNSMRVTRTSGTGTVAVAAVA